MSSTEIARRSQVAARPRILRLRIIKTRCRQPGLRETAAWVHDNWRHMTPAQAGEAGERLGRMIGKR